jgi:hypothetical protein
MKYRIHSTSKWKRRHRCDDGRYHDMTQVSLTTPDGEHITAHLTENQWRELKGIVDDYKKPS